MSPDEVQAYIKAITEGLTPLFQQAEGPALLIWKQAIIRVYVQAAMHIILSCTGGVVVWHLIRRLHLISAEGNDPMHVGMVTGIFTCAWVPYTVFVMSFHVANLFSPHFAAVQKIADLLQGTAP